jgi:transcriptional regulator with PAS, ATPase and Fis domain
VSSVNDQPPFQRILGESSAIRSVRKLLAQIALSPASTVLLVGESGTGKGLAAQELHRASTRAPFRFETICCAALPETLLESELFGHEAGAFTDARRRKKGLLEMADGGTVFLDEIAETNPTVQVKLLHFLEERRFKRVGGTSDIAVDVRIVAATNQNLERAVRAGSFRADLYYRLGVLPVRMPPLRERIEDVPLLARHFIGLFNEQLGRRVRGLAGGSAMQLQSYGWPGNIRELRNLVERAMLLGQDDLLVPEEYLPSATAAPVRRRLFELPAEGIDLEQLELDLVTQALERTGGNRTRAAELLGLTRHQIQYRIQKLQLEADDDRAAGAAVASEIEEDAAYAGMRRAAVADSMPESLRRS